MTAGLQQRCVALAGSAGIRHLVVRLSTEQFIPSALSAEG